MVGQAINQEQRFERPARWQDGGRGTSYPPLECTRAAWPRFWQEPPKQEPDVPAGPLAATTSAVLDTIWLIG